MLFNKEINARQDNQITILEKAEGVDFDANPNLLQLEDEIDVEEDPPKGAAEYA